VVILKVVENSEKIAEMGAARWYMGDIGYALGSI